MPATSTLLAPDSSAAARQARWSSIDLSGSSNASAMARPRSASASVARSPASCASRTARSASA